MTLSLLTGLALWSLGPQLQSAEAAGNTWTKEDGRWQIVSYDVLEQ